MSSGLNKVMLLGNLCTDPELRHTQSGQSVLNIRLATNDIYLDKNGERQKRVEFHSVVVWNKRAEALASILRKGSQILVEGRLQTSSYEDREGNKRFKTEVIALQLQLTGRKGDSTEGPPRVQDPNSNHGLGDDDIAF